MAGTAEGAAKSRAKRAENERQFRALADGPGRREKGAEVLPPDDLPVPVDAALMQQNQQPQQSVSPMGMLVPKAVRTVGRALTAKNVSWPARLSAAFYVLGSCGIGPQQSGDRAAAVAADPGQLSESDLRAFVEAGARAMALRVAKASAIDAEIVSERPASVTPAGKPEPNQA